jgi:hypothetical protein
MSESKKNIKTKSDAAIPYDIPVEGSLGLLALGAVGIMEWKKVRNAHNKRKLEEEKND